MGRPRISEDTIRIRIRSSHKDALQLIADADHSGNVSDLVRVILSEYLKDVQAEYNLPNFDAVPD